MFGHRRFQVLLVVACVAKTVCADVGREVSPLQDVNQADAETILAAQTAFRRYLIESLANLQEKIFHFHTFHSVVDGILRGLRSRDLNPLKSFRSVYGVDSNQSGAHQMATAIYSLQGCSSEETTFAVWLSFLETVPDIDVIVPPPPDILLSPYHLHKANTPHCPYVVLVLLAIHQRHFAPTGPLLAHILYNYPFKNYSPDLDTAVANVVQLLASGEGLMDSFLPNPASIERPSEILFDVLKFLLQLNPSGPGLAFHTAQLLSALSNSENVAQSKVASTPWEVFDLIRDGDYPEDVVTAAKEVAVAVWSNQVNVEPGSFRGYSRLESLLGVISQLTATPSEDSISRKVHAIYPHVKLRYLSTKERFFRPQSSLDVAFLLNSFLTVPSGAFIEEIHKIFLQRDFNWRKILEDFDFSKYSKPRPLLTDMLQELLRNSDHLSTRDLILLSYFLRNSSQVPTYATPRANEDGFSWKRKSPIAPIIVFDLTDEAFGAKPTATQCMDGPPVELIDPESITEIIATNHYTTFITDLIRFNPMPVDRYPNKTRVAIYRTLLGNLRANKYNDSVTAFVIQQALMRIPLNEKAHLPPRYLYLCPFQVAAIEAKAPTPKTPPCEPISVIDQESIIDITNQDPNFNKIKHLLSAHTIHYEQYKNLSTREEVLRAFLSDRRTAAGPVEQLEISHIISRLVISCDGQLQPVIRQQCPTIPPPSGSANAHCKPPSTVKILIDPLCLMEIMETTVEPIEQLLSKVPLLAERYLNLGNRSNILLYFLREHYSDCDESGGELPNLKINDRGNLPPVLKQKCVVSVVPTPPHTLPPPYPPTRPCLTHETLTAVYDPESLFEALESPSKPVPPYIREWAKTYLVPFDPKKEYTRAQVLRMTLNALAATTTDQKTLENIYELKSRIVCRKEEVAKVVGACLPKNVVEERMLLGDDCQADEGAVAVVNTETLLVALSPNALPPPRVKNGVKGFIIPVSTRGKLTKGDVLRNVLSYMERNVDSGTREAVAALKDSVMSTGPAAEEPDVVYLCVSKSVVEDIQSEEMLMVHSTALLGHSSTESPAFSVPPSVGTTSQQLSRGESQQPDTMSSSPEAGTATPSVSGSQGFVVEFTTAFSPFSDSATTLQPPTSTRTFPSFSSLDVAAVPPPPPPPVRVHAKPTNYSSFTSGQTSVFPPPVTAAITPRRVFIPAVTASSSVETPTAKASSRSLSGRPFAVTTTLETSSFSPPTTAAPFSVASLDTTSSPKAAKASSPSDTTKPFSSPPPAPLTPNSTYTTMTSPPLHTTP